MENSPISEKFCVEANVVCSSAYSFLQTLDDESVDLLVTSPPYFIGKEYDTSKCIEDFTLEFNRVLPEITRIIKQGGSVCWQVGNHVEKNSLIPLDSIIVSNLLASEDLYLRNRIIWTYNHGPHLKTRFSGRYETILWYTKGDNYYFDLDSVRVPQLYPGKRHYKGPKKGQWSGNPMGKNPGDFWDLGDIWSIPSVKANHVEKTSHPCQYPTSLARRLVVSLSPKGGLVIDPYTGSGTTAVAALLEERNFKGSDIEQKYVDIAQERISDTYSGAIRVREDIPVERPNDQCSVAKRPPHFHLVTSHKDE